MVASESCYDLTINAIAYNPASQIVSQVRSNDAYSWTGHGNGSTATVTDGLNRLVTVGGTSAVYDGKGNLATDPVNAKTYGYWTENALASAPGTTVYYDPIGRLAEYDTNVSTRFMSDGVQLAVEIENSPANTIQKRWVWGDGPDELLVEYVGSGTTTRRWAHADERGSIVALSDGSGNATAKYRYDEYGRPQDNATRSMQYTGQLWLPETGMYHYKMRNYGAHLGRFSQTDPIGYGAGPNLYAYVMADPVNGTDPLGLCDPVTGSGCEQVVTGTLNKCPSFMTCTSGPVTLIYATTYALPKVFKIVFGGRGGGKKGEKKLPPCAQSFLKGRITGNPADITLHRGGSMWNWFDNSVTYGSDIYLAGDSFGRSDKGALIHKFHEIAHASQNARMGLSGMQHGAAYVAFGGHDSSPLEQAADDFAQAAYDAYKKAGLDKTCPF